MPNLFNARHFPTCSNAMFVIKLPQKLTSSVSNSVSDIKESTHFSVNPQTNETESAFKFGHDLQIMLMDASVRNEQSLSTKYSSSSW